MKAQNESESLAHMGAMLERHTMLSGRDLDWTNSKTHALQAIYAHWKDANPDSHTPFRITDLGIGDMLCLRNWEDFPETRYVGVDGCPLVLEQAAERHPDLTFLDLSFYNLVKERTVFDTDLIVSLDTLYHIPSQEVHDKMVEVIFNDCNKKYAIISWATYLRWHRWLQLVPASQPHA